MKSEKLVNGVKRILYIGLKIVSFQQQRTMLSSQIQREKELVLAEQLLML